MYVNFILLSRCHSIKRLLLLLFIQSIAFSSRYHVARMSVEWRMLWIRMRFIASNGISSLDADGQDWLRGGEKAVFCYGSDDISISVDFVLAIFFCVVLSTQSGSLHSHTLASWSSLPSRHIDQKCAATQQWPEFRAFQRCKWLNDE